MQLGDMQLGGGMHATEERLARMENGDGGLRTDEVLLRAAGAWCCAGRRRGPGATAQASDRDPPGVTPATSEQAATL
jgi:hypothetical protein